jgi:pimeloyl-ACP methyl ester carboxylesterase
MAAAPSPFKSRESEAALLAWHARAVASLAAPHEERELATALGRTFVVAAGPAGGPPLVLVHGLGTNAAALAREIDFFAAHGYRVFAPEVPGQPGRSEPRALSLKDGSLGRWMAEVLDGLSLSRARWIGYSLGGFVVLKLAALAPERIERAVLAVPAGLSSPTVWRALPQILLRLLYMATGSPRFRQRLIAGMFAPRTTPDPFLVEALEVTFEHARVDPKPIPVLRAEALAELRAPLLVLAGEHDPFFSCAATLAGAARVVPSAVAERLDGTGHVIDQEHSGAFHARVLRFLSE